MKQILFVGLLVAFVINSQAQVELDSPAESAYLFRNTVDLPATSIKDQYRSGTCWAFSGLSFLESELIRMGKGEHDLSEMWLVKHDYHARAIDYVRWQGAKNFSGGAESNNVFDRIKSNGIVPEEAFSGLNYGEPNHVHGEMDHLLKAYVKAVVKNKNKKLTPAWIKGFDGILDAYLGTDIGTFIYNGKDYTPASFRDAMGIIPDNYIEIGSYLHHPYYEEFVLEVPDNWALGKVFNVPLDEMLQVAYNALDKGYTVLWGSDVSEDGFSHTNGVAIVPQDISSEMNGNERAKWEALPENERDNQLDNFMVIEPEKTITPELRQQAFDNYTTTDDHGMHITGYATDQDRNRYFKVKNSWNTDNPYQGYFYASESWFLYKTISIVVHKDAVPKDLLKKMQQGK